MLDGMLKKGQDPNKQDQDNQQSGDQSPAKDNTPPSTDGDWRSTLPEDIRMWDEAKNADDPEKFWSQIKHMRARLGRSLTIPSEDASEEERKKFLEKVRKHVPELIPMPSDPESFDSVLKALGKPDDPKEYEYPEIALPEGVSLDQTRLEAFKEMAHQAGLTKRQFEAITEMYLKSEAEKVQQMMDAEQQELSALRKEWGAAFEDKAKLAYAVKEQYFPWLGEQLNAKMMMSLASIAENMGKEPQLAPNDADRQLLTPEEAEMQLASIMNNRQHPYWNPSDPAHKAARKRVRELTALKLGQRLKE